YHGKRACTAARGVGKHTFLTRRGARRRPRRLGTVHAPTCEPIGAESNPLRPGAHGISWVRRPLGKKRGTRSRRASPNRGKVRPFRFGGTRRASVAVSRHAENAVTSTSEGKEHAPWPSRFASSSPMTRRCTTSR